MIVQRGHDVPPRSGPLRRAAPALCGLAIALGLLQPAAAADQSAAPCQAGAAAPIRLLVTATGAHRIAGNITFTLYGDKPARFLAHHGSIALTRVTLTASSAEGCFAIAAPGTYAVAVYHDANDNHRFDRTLIGLPAEGYGFSNDAPALVGLPSFNAVTIRVQPGDNHITVRLRY